VLKKENEMNNVITNENGELEYEGGGFNDEGGVNKK
jgi:hypothetical protein